MLDLIPADRNVSIEREVWPQLVGEGLFGFAAEAYWLDIGTPERYLQGTFDILEGNVATAVADRLGPGYLAVGDRVQADGRIVPPALVERGCDDRRGRARRLAGRARRGRDAWGRARRSSARWSSTAPRSARDCVLRDCIVAAGVRIGEGSEISGGAVLGEGVTVGARNVLSRGVRVFPQTDLPEGAITF